METFSTHDFIAPMLAAGAAVMLAGCMHHAALPVEAGSGPDPALPPPPPAVRLPTVKIAPAQGWPAGVSPIPADGLAVNAFATGLDHPRWLHVLPNGDVLVAESNAQPGSGPGGLKGWIMKKLQKTAGAAVPSADRISLLRDADGDGEAELRFVFLDDLTSPFGMALVGDTLYVANTDALVRFPYTEGATRLQSAAETVAPLPAGPVNYHWTKTIVANPDGSRIYATVGSNSNVGERGMESETGRAAIWEIDPATGQSQIFASGLRNPVGLAWEPATGRLWTTVNERDLLGSDLVPDYLTSVQQGGFYGWPYSYFGQHVDERVQPQRPDLVAAALVPDYALGAHTASLGLAFYSDGPLPPDFHDGAFVGQHGSWNRRPPSGYRVVFVRFEDGQPAGLPVEVLTGFLNRDGEALGRPVGVAVDRAGNLLVADDVGNTIWRVHAATEN